jgi:hypothetical protein
MSVLFSRFLYFKKYCFLSAFSVSHDSDDISEFKIKYPGFFSEFSYSCFFYTFSDFAASFWKHDLAFFVTDTQELYHVPSFACTDAACAGLKPKKGRNIPF